MAFRIVTLKSHKERPTGCLPVSVRTSVSEEMSIHGVLLSVFVLFNRQQFSYNSRFSFSKHLLWNIALFGARNCTSEVQNQRLQRGR